MPWRRSGVLRGPMNRILYETDECRDGKLRLRVSRAEHIRRVLKARPGDSLQLGEIGGPLTEGRGLTFETEPRPH